MKIAVASTDGKVVNAHFGRTPQFLIFEMTQDATNYLETRENLPGCSSLDAPQGSMEDTIELIKDCQVVLVNKIGRAMVERLQEKGIQAIRLGDFIQDALKQVFETVYLQEDNKN